MYLMYFGILGERSLRWEFVEENYVQVTVLISLFTLLSVLVKFFFAYLLEINLLIHMKNFKESVP